jgi:hypothetical protein
VDEFEKLGSELTIHIQFEVAMYLDGEVLSTDFLQSPKRTAFGMEGTHVLSVLDLVDVVSLAERLATMMGNFVIRNRVAVDELFSCSGQLRWATREMDTINRESTYNFEGIRLTVDPDF